MLLPSLVNTTLASPIPMNRGVVPLEKRDVLEMVKREVGRLTDVTAKSCEHHTGVPNRI